MKVNIINITGFNQYVDLDGVANTDDIIVIGPKETVKSVEIPNEKRFLSLSKEFRNKLVIRKV